MKIEPRTLKGFRDFLPNEARKRQYVINILKRVFESYGFEPLETPALEYAEILTDKYGDEGDKLMYRFKDNGARDVALRYDQTVPLARVIAEYRDKLPMPFKRYQIQNVWRAENTQKGRFREFLQCDIDTVGTNSINADIEVLRCIYDCLKSLGISGFSILVNSRKVFEQLGMNSDVVRILDKKDKIGEEAMISELNKLFASNDEATNSYSTLKNLKPYQIPERLNKILEYSNELNLFPAFFLARGLDYYTDLIFEVRIENYKGGSVAGGGRYDDLIGMFTNRQIPAVGAAFGFDRIIEAMDALNLFPKDLQTTKVLVLNLPNLEDKAMEIAGKLRLNEINAEIYLDSNVEKGKQFNYAEKKNIPYTIVVDNNETFTLGFKNENGEIERKENLSFANLLELLPS